MFDPRGDWSTARHGLSRGVPGMEEPPAEGPQGAKKKKKKKTGQGGGAETGQGDGEEGACEAVEPAPRESGREEVVTEEMQISKRIKAVQKKLKGAAVLQAEAAGGKELNVDQRAKISAIDDMQQVRWSVMRGRVRRVFGGAHPCAYTLHVCVCVGGVGRLWTPVPYGSCAGAPSICFHLMHRAVIFMEQELADLEAKLKAVAVQSV